MNFMKGQSGDISSYFRLFKILTKPISNCFIRWNFEWTSFLMFHVFCFCSWKAVCMMIYHLVVSPYPPCKCLDIKGHDDLWGFKCSPKGSKEQQSRVCKPGIPVVIDLPLLWLLESCGYSLMVGFPGGDSPSSINQQANGGDMTCTVKVMCGIPNADLSKKGNMW